MTVTPQEIIKALSDPAIGSELHRIAHQYSDKDQGSEALHHTLGRMDGQALPRYVASEDYEGTDETTPNPPTGLVVTKSLYYRATGTPAVRVNIDWTPPTENTDGSALTDLEYYETQWRFNGDTVWGGTVQTDAEEVFYDNFNPGDNIDVRVRAVDVSNNKSDWSEDLFNALDVDTSAPESPSTPTLDNTTFFGMIRVIWDGLDDDGDPQASDYRYTQVHASTASGFTPDESTLRDTLFAAGVSDVFGDVGTTLYIKLVSYDTSDNFSAPSPEVSAAILGADTDDLLDDIITNAKIALDAVDTANIVDGAVTNALLAINAVDTANIVDAAILEAKLDDDSVSTTKIQALAVTTAKIDNLAVTNGKIDNLAVDNAKIANLAVDSAKIDDLAVTNAKIDNLAVSTAKIQLLAVTTALIDNAAITNAKIDNLAVTDAKINDLVVSKITSGTISFDWAIGSRIATDLIGNARAQMDSAGFRVFNSLNAEVAYLKIVAGVPALYVSGGTIEGGTITGPLFRTAASGIRMEIGNDWLSDGTSDLNYIVFYMDDADEEHGGYLFANLSPQANSAEDSYYTTLSSGRFLTNYDSTLSLISGQRTYGTTEDSMATLTASGDVLNGYITVYGSGRVQLQDVLYVDETTGGTHINRLGVGYQALGTTEYDYSNSAFVVNNSGAILFQGTIQDVDLTNDGQPLTIGKKQASGVQLIIDNNEIQCRVRNAGNTAWSAQNMAINASGGLVTIGNAAASTLSCKINEGNSVSAADDTGTLQVGDSSGTNMGIGTASIQVRSGGSGAAFAINAAGGGIDIGGNTAHTTDLKQQTVRFPNIGTTGSATNARFATASANSILVVTSSVRYKTDIQDFDLATYDIRKLRPVSFKARPDVDRHEASPRTMWGLIAEEVDEAGFIPLVDYDVLGPEAVYYDRLAIPMLAALQDLINRVEILEG